MADMKIVVVGAGGRMGQSLVRAVTETDGVELVAAIEHEDAACIGTDCGEMAGVGNNGITVTSDALEAFANADGVLDFTVPAASVEFSGLAAQARIVHVIGTTGCSEEDEKKFVAASRHARIVKSGNMSLGVNLLAVLVKQAARSLAAGDFDIEVLEMHHKHKVDAPSGTALLLGKAAAEGRKIQLSDKAVKVRDGIIGERDEGTIGFATLRGGSVIGEHSVFFAGEGETIEIAHRATDRQLFAHGAVKAALWAYDKKPGRYDMLDVLGLAKDSDMTGASE